MTCRYLITEWNLDFGFLRQDNENEHDGGVGVNENIRVPDCKC